MSEENLNIKFEEEFNKLSEKDKREVNNLIRFMQEKKYHDSQYEELLNQYIELSRDYDELENIIKEVSKYANTDKNCIPKHIKDYINNLLDKEVN